MPPHRPRCRPGALAALLSLLAGCSEPEEPTPTFDGPRHVILISLDTLRADATTLYGYEKDTTPFLQRLATERGVLFENHMVNSNNTLTSHATMLTGLLMMVHQAEDRPQDRRPLAPEHVTLAERFGEAGFRTAGFAAHPIWISQNFGLHQGFETFASEWVDARSTNDDFLDWVDDERPRRIFAFLHYYDAHSESKGRWPYAAPREYLQQFAPPRPDDFSGSIEVPRGRGTKELTASAYLGYYDNHARDFPPGHLEFLRGSYDAGVAKLDSDIEELFGDLEERGILDDALIVVTSDHGEEFKEHRGTLHNQYFDEIMKVPLIIVPPAGTPRPVKRVEQVSRCVDIAATLLDLAGLEPLETTQGRSLRPLLEGTDIGYAETLFGRGVLRGLDERSEYKVCIVPDNPIFFDLGSDPGELTNLLASAEGKREHGNRMNAARRRVGVLRRECDLLRAKIDASTGIGPELDQRQLDELRALGYIGDDEDEPLDE